MSELAYARPSGERRSCRAGARYCPDSFFLHLIGELVVRGIGARSVRIAGRGSAGWCRSSIPAGSCDYRRAQPGGSRHPSASAPAAAFAPPDGGVITSAPASALPQRHRPIMLGVVAGTAATTLVGCAATRLIGGSTRSRPLNGIQPGLPPGDLPVTCRIRNGRRDTGTPCLHEHRPASQEPLSGRQF